MTRVFFSKKDRSKYISHLDLTRCLSRAFARTGIPIWYTEGFNPHVYMTFALPLPLGFEGARESMDIKLTDDEYPLENIARELNPVLPIGMEVLGAAPVVDKPEAIVWADYSIRLHHPDASGLEQALWAFLAREEIVVTKKSKHRAQELDLRPHFRVLRLEGGRGAVDLELRMAAGPGLNVSPALLLGAYESSGGPVPEHIQVERTAILRADLSGFA